VFRGGGGDVTKAFINLGILFLSRTVDLSVRTKRTRRRVPVIAAVSGAIVSVLRPPCGISSSYEIQSCPRDSSAACRPQSPEFNACMSYYISQAVLQLACRTRVDTHFTRLLHDRLRGPPYKKSSIALQAENEKD